MSAYGNMEKAVAGLAYGQDTQYDSRVAGVEIAFSDAVFAPAGNSEIVNKTQTGELLGVAGRTQKDPLVCGPMKWEPTWPPTTFSVKAPLALAWPSWKSSRRALCNRAWR